MTPRPRASRAPANDAEPPVHPTRKALLRAAIRYMREWGELPSFAEVAIAADIPRRTAYRYFTTVEELATAATLELLRPEMNKLIAEGFTSDDPATRIVSTVRNIVRLAVENERVFRAMIRLTIGKSTARGIDRLTWFRTALEPAREHLGEKRFERLVRAIAISIGFEGLIAFKDMFDTDPEETERIVTWIAQTLVRQALDDAGARTLAR